MKQYRSGIEVVLIAFMWIAVFALTPRGFDIAWPIEFWLRQLFFAIILAMAYFINSRFLLPRFFSENKYLIYVGTIILLTAVILLTMSAFEIQIGLPRKMHEIFRPNRPFDPDKNHISFNFVAFTLVMLNFSIGVIVHLFRKAQEESEKRKELEKLQISTELSYLKAQINPHFFFNTLNNIYALTAIDTEASRKAILKLSSMMRYVISEDISTLSTVSDEINFIANYIDLMRLRISKRVSVRFEKPDNPADLKIAPMLLQPFVENAFKYGMSSSMETEIYISIETSGRSLQFTVKNDIVSQPESSSDENGIGISNTRRRLDLIYPNAHNLKIDKEGGTFIVTLSINL